jgi:hypothetical protein
MKSINCSLAAQGSYQTTSEVNLRYWCLFVQVARHCADQCLMAKTQPPVTYGSNRSGAAKPRRPRTIPNQSSLSVSVPATVGVEKAGDTGGWGVIKLLAPATATAPSVERLPQQRFRVRLTILVHGQSAVGVPGPLEREFGRLGVNYRFY